MVVQSAKRRQNLRTEPWDSATLSKLPESRPIDAAHGYSRAVSQTEGVQANHRYRPHDAVRTFALSIGIFCLCAATALTAVKWGPAWEHRWLCFLGAIGLTTWKIQRRDELYIAICIAISAAFLLFDAITASTIGGGLGWTAFAGVPALISLACLGTIEKRIGEALIPSVLCVWIGGWALFFFNAPDDYKPFELQSSIGPIIDWTFITIFWLIIAPLIFAFFGSQVMSAMGIDPSSIGDSFRSQDETAAPPSRKAQKTNVAHSKWATARPVWHDLTDDIEEG